MAKRRPYDETLAGWRLPAAMRKERGIVSGEMPADPDAAPYDLWSYYRAMAEPGRGLFVVRANADGWCRFEDEGRTETRYVGTDRLFETKEDAERYVALLWLKGDPA